MVSIRAPAWGATTRQQNLALSRRGFDPRSRVGSDRAAYNWLAQRYNFVLVRECRRLSGLRLGSSVLRTIVD